MKYTFGPVNSRRFGLSLGIDLSPDEKSCNFDCLYCELKSAKPRSSIKNPPNVQEVVSEVKRAINEYKDINVITITSNGEPTLYEDLDELVDELNRIKNGKKLLILSNSSTICNKQIQQILKKIDIVKLSLDCVTKECFKKIDRALNGIEISSLTQCIRDFSKDFNNKLIIETLLVKGINDNKKEFEKLYETLKDIDPDRVDIGTIDRPPAYNVKPVEQDKIIELSTIFTNIPVSIIYKQKPKAQSDFSKDEILQLLSHRPQSQFDIDNFFSENAKEIFKKLLKNKEIKKQDIGGVIFYRV